MRDIWPTRCFFHGPGARGSAPLHFWCWLRFRHSAFPLASGTVPLNDNQATPNPRDNQVPLTRSPLIKARGGGGSGDGAIFDSADWSGEAATEALQSERSTEAPTNFPAHRWHWSLLQRLLHLVVMTLGFVKGIKTRS